ncbi:MAG: lysophospholipid acyltransferase family protein [Bacteriovoracaceae bacterium]|nr:lysophospholipid acyltransferase family protein [Bacteriovoracaceae bacterium]
MLHYIIQRLIWVLIKTLVSTYRFEILGIHFRDEAEKIQEKGAYVFAVWHEQVLSVLAGHAWTRPYLALASRSKDGDYAAFISEKLGFVAVRGSSKKKNKDKGGREAMLTYIKRMSEGTCGGITVDGPKGPRNQCKPGIVIIAKESKAPIIPVVAVANRYWEFNSWDRFKVPKPFAKIKMVYGKPITVPTDSTEEDVNSIAQQVTQSLNELTEKTVF